MHGARFWQSAPLCMPLCLVCIMLMTHTIQALSSLTKQRHLWPSSCPIAGSIQVQSGHSSMQGTPHTGNTLSGHTETNCGSFSSFWSSALGWTAFHHLGVHWMAPPNSIPYHIPLPKSLQQHHCCPRRRYISIFSRSVGFLSGSPPAGSVTGLLPWSTAVLEEGAALDQSQGAEGSGSVAAVLAYHIIRLIGCILLPEPASFHTFGTNELDAQEPTL